LRLDLHPDRLVDLHPNGAFLEILIELPDHPRSKTRRLELSRIKGRDPRGTARVRARYRERVRMLRLEALVPAVPRINHVDVDERQIEALQQVVQGRMVYEDVGVRVD